MRAVLIVYVMSFQSARAIHTAADAADSAIRPAASKTKKSIVMAPPKHAPHSWAKATGRTGRVSARADSLERVNELPRNSGPQAIFLEADPRAGQLGNPTVPAGIVIRRNGRAQWGIEATITPYQIGLLRRQRSEVLNER